MNLEEEFHRYKRQSTSEADDREIERLTRETLLNQLRLLAIVQQRAIANPRSGFWANQVQRVVVGLRLLARDYVMEEDE